ncbi:MAG: ABC transporter ATP-binding protein [Rhodospirillales bacterium]
MAEVKITDVRKSYGAFPVIHGVSVTAPGGSFTALVGPSGCGKSTLLRMIAGLEDINSGYISIDGGIINDVEPKNRDIAMVFQNYALYPHMTIAENMGFSLRLGRRPKSEIKERVAAVAQILGLSEYLDRYPKQLSGGQRQRVAMGRAIVRNPKVFLFDEPLSNLDAKLRVQMRAELKEMHSRLRITTIYVTHDQIEAMTMADQIVVMHEGNIEQVGKPLDLYDRPVNPFVAGFIGSPAMNLLHGRAEGDTFIAADTDAVLPLPPGQPAAGGVIYGVRPEHLDLSDNPRATSAEVVFVEPTGSDTFLGVRIGGASLSVFLRRRADVQPGQTVRLMPSLADVHLFNRENGERLN